MPEVSRFYGITIRIHFIQAEHNPPHFHATYEKQQAVFDINTAEKIKGKLPATAEYLVRQWAAKNKEELLKIWDTQNFSKIPPLE